MPSGEPVAIVPYDPAWPARFEAERVRIAAAAGPLVLAIEHIGSTAVPALAAKPIVDILGGCASLADAERTAPALERDGWDYRGDLGIADHRILLKHVNGARAFHLHLCERGGDFWRRHLAFRDALRARPDIVAAYATLKRELAARYRDDRVAYTEAKTDFVTATVVAATRARALVSE
jgi:GrpB-like predicted nucleotidyltransferase (UPF0157 family)